MSATSLFRPPQRVLAAASADAGFAPDTQVLGVVAGGRARAYPIRLLAYHHVVSDQLGGEPLLPT